MSVARAISEHRSTFILIVLVGFSLTSLISGAEASFIQRALRGAVDVTARPFLKTVRGAGDAADYVSGLVFSYDAARDEADAMRGRFAELMVRTARRRELAEENQRLRRKLAFVRSQPRLGLESAEVIANFKGILKIDRGSTHGVRESMSVLTEDGVVGLITEVGLTTATVVTLHNVDCRIGAMIRRNRVRGVVHGTGSDLRRICSMEYIDMKDDVREGDEVVASPESLFPSGYPVGRVVSVHDSGALWKFAYVEPAVAPYRLDEVFIVRRALPPLEELAPPGPSAAALPMPRAPELPDHRTIQQRYAP